MLESTVFEKELGFAGLRELNESEACQTLKVVVGCDTASCVEAVAREKGGWCCVLDELRMTGL